MRALLDGRLVLDAESIEEGADDATRGCRRRRWRGADQGAQAAGGGRRLSGDDHRGDDRADVGLEEVGAHAGDVADVVTDVVGDGGGVPRVVLGDARVDLADEVGADVGGLGVDAAADAAEERDGGAAETESGEALHEVEGVLVGAPVGAVGLVNKDGVPVLEVDGEEVREDVEHEHGEAAEGESHDGAGAEGGVEGGGPAGLRPAAMTVVRALAKTATFMPM